MYVVRKRIRIKLMYARCELSLQEKSISDARIKNGKRPNKFQR